MYLNNFSKRIGITLSVYTFLSGIGLAADAKESREEAGQPTAMTSMSCPPSYTSDDIVAIELLRRVNLEETSKNIEAANIVLTLEHYSESIKARDILFFVQPSRP